LPRPQTTPPPKRRSETRMLPSLSYQTFFLEVPTARKPDVAVHFAYRNNRIFPTSKAAG
jgi:hypothetical protein